MKNRGYLLLFIFLALGFSFSGCATTSQPTPPPVLTELITIDGSLGAAWTWNAKTSFSVNEYVGIGVRWETPSRAITRFAKTTKRDGIVVLERTWNVSVGGRNMRGTHGFTSWRFDQPGNYTVEVYALDSKSNRSNTLIYTFTVTQ